MKIKVIDTETNIKSSRKGYAADPYYPDNHIVYLGCTTFGGGVLEHKSNKSITHRGVDIVTNNSVPLWFEPLSKTDMLVGHNIKFDLHYLVKDGYLSLPDFANLLIWDTAYAEYLLTGQASRMPSLDSLSKKYGGTQKNSKIKEYWEAGIDTEDIPKNEIVPYLEDDVRNTTLVMVRQLQKAKELGLLSYITRHMEALKATFLMELTGIKVNKKGLFLYEQTLISEIVQYDKAYSELYLKILASNAVDKVSEKDLKDLSDTINIFSSTNLGILLYGGEFKYKVKEFVGKYKNGNDKFKLVDKTIKVKAALPENSLKKLTDSGKPSVDKHVIDTLCLDKDISKHSADLLTLLNVRKKQNFVAKELSTYVSPTLNTLTINRSDTIHHSLNNTAVSTGRLSSSNPNLQNLSGKDNSYYKQFLVADLIEDDTVFVEIDYSQLEVIALAYLSGDKQLKKDILNGVDIHTEVGTRGLGLTIGQMSDTVRRNVKGVVFGTIYGGGAKKLAEQTGFDVSDVKRIQREFFSRYKGLEPYYNIIKLKLEKNKKLGPGADNSAAQEQYAEYSLFYGRKWVFKKEGLPWNQSVLDWPMPKVRNWPVQGFATGDLVPMAFAVVMRYIFKNSLHEKVFLVNTVHDSIYLKMPDHMVTTVVPDIIKIMTDTKELLEPIGVKDFDLPLTVKMKVGKNLKEMKEVDINDL